MQDNARQCKTMQQRISCESFWWSAIVPPRLAPLVLPIFRLDFWYCMTFLMLDSSCVNKWKWNDLNQLECKQFICIINWTALKIRFHTICLLSNHDDFLHAYSNTKADNCRKQGHIHNCSCRGWLGRAVMIWAGAVMIWAGAVMIWAGVVMIWAGVCPKRNFPTLKMPKKCKKSKVWQTDGQTDRRTDGPTDRPTRWLIESRARD